MAYAMLIVVDADDPIDAHDVATSNQAPELLFIGDPWEVATGSSTGPMHEFDTRACIDQYPEDR